MSIAEPSGPGALVKLDFLIPASPTDGFFSQIAMFQLALDALGGPYRAARLVAVFGDTHIVPLPPKWEPFFSRIDVEWADCAAFERMSYHATGQRRFEVYRKQADLVIMCDADTLLLRPFPELIERMRNAPALAGVVANRHIPWPDGSGNSREDWHRIARGVLGRDIPLSHRYLRDREKACPFYLNAGFIAATPAIFERLHVACKELWPRVDRFMGTYFSSQVTTCLAVDHLALPTLSLPRRYNFANYVGSEYDAPSELENLIVFHYFSTDFFNRQRIFTTASRFERFLSLELDGCNRLFQERIRDITGGQFPFLGAEAEPVEAEDQYDALRVEVGRLRCYAQSLEIALRDSQAYSLSLEQRNSKFRWPWRRGGSR